MAQDVPAPDPEVQKLLQLLQDGTRPSEYRLQTANRILSGGHPDGLAGLKRILGTPEAAPDLKLIVITAVVYQGDSLDLLDDVLAATVAAGNEEFRTEVGKKVSWARSPALVKALSARAAAPAISEPLRLLAIGLLADSGLKSAVPVLIGLWEAGQAPFADAAREAFARILPLKFHAAAEAKAFWDQNSSKGLETILREALRAAGTRDDNGTHRRILIELARSMLPEASLTTLLTRYLGCRDVFELRVMGAQRLGAFPYGDPKSDGAEPRKTAAAGLLEALKVEDVPQAEIALLMSARALSAELREVGGEEIRSLVLSRMDHPLREVRLAATQAAGELRDPAMIEELARRYDALAGADKELQLALLDAVELSGNGNTDWVLEKLRTKDQEEEIVLRLIRLLKKYKDRPEIDPGRFVSALIEVLSDRSRSAKVRQETVITLGLIGVPRGIPEAIDALAVLGLADEDPSVRDIAATQLGRAPKADGKIIELLRARLGDAEQEDRVKRSAARSLLNLRGAQAVRYLKILLTEDAFWQETVRGFLVRNLIGAGDAEGSVALVRALDADGLTLRCAESARLVLVAGDLKWEGEAEHGRGEVAYLLTHSLDSLGKDAEALKVLTEDWPETIPADPMGVERIIHHARLLRETGSPGKVAAVLQKISDLPEPPEGALTRAALEAAQALLDLKKPAEAVKVLKPHVNDPTFGREAQEILTRAEAAVGAPPPPPAEDPKEIAKAIASLDGGDPAKRATAVTALAALGEKAHPALLAWLSTRKPADLPAAFETIAAITGITVPYDPKAPEEARQKALADLRAKLGG